MFAGHVFLFIENSAEGKLHICTVDNYMMLEWILHTELMTVWRRVHYIQFITLEF